MPAMQFGDLAKVFIAETTGSYYCCDYYETGVGYMFTNCGGRQVVILNYKINSTMSQQVIATNQTSNIMSPLWDFNQLQSLIASKCNNTYMAVGEFMLDGGYELWITMDLPW